jgi:LPS O-antigen subunit length determinant protein (WzzB/FepE family)
MEENKNNTNQQEPYYEDEIDLVELFAVIWKRKTIIVVFVFLVSVAAVVYSLMQDNIYQSKAVLSPSQSEGSSRFSNLANQLGPLSGMLPGSIGGGGQNTYNSMKNLLDNQKFLAGIVKENKFYNNLFEDYQELQKEEDFEKHKDYMFYKAFRDIISIDKDDESGFITLAVKHKDRVFTKKAVDVLLMDISSHMKKNELQNINLKIENYKDEIANASDISLKNKLSELVATLIQSKVMAKAQTYYGFEIISEPYVPDELDKVGPNRKLICIVAFVTACILSVFMVFLYEFIQSNKDHFQETIKEKK